MGSPTQVAYDSLFVMYVVIGTVVGAAVIASLLYFALRYRSRADDPNGDSKPDDDPLYPAKGAGERGSPKIAIAMVAAILALLFGLTLGTMHTVDVIEHVPPEAAITVKVTAYQYGWEFGYPEGFTNQSILRIPAGKVVRLDVTSRDVMHNFAIPDYRVKTDAIPGQVNTIWVQDDTPGDHSIQCMELCGVAHSYMRGTVRVMTAAEFDAWRAASAAAGGG